MFIPNNKKSIKYLAIFIAAFIIIGYLGIQRGIFNKYNCITALIDSSKSYNNIIVVGELDPYDQFRNIIAPNFHFKFIYYGCNTSYSSNQGIRDYNTLMINKIKKINGKEWDVKFRDELIRLIVKNALEKKQKI